MTPPKTAVKANVAVEAPKKKLTREELMRRSKAAIAKVTIQPEHDDDVWKLDLTESK